MTGHNLSNPTNRNEARALMSARAVSTGLFSGIRFETYMEDDHPRNDLIKILATFYAYWGVGAKEAHVALGQVLNEVRNQIEALDPEFMPDKYEIVWLVEVKETGIA